MRERSSPLLSQIRWFVVLGMMCGAVSALFVAPFAVRAMPPLGWTHDHSAAGIPTRPHGYNRLVAVFGSRATTRRVRHVLRGRRSPRPVWTATSRITRISTAT